jgi:ornithine carbamoyltransferase
MKHFIALKDFTSREVAEFIDLSIKIKNKPLNYSKRLRGKCIGLLFEKPSVRTKTAFYVGALQLGAQAIYYTPQEVKLGEREKVSDVASTLASYLDAVVLRTFEHNTVSEFAKFSTIPVINGLSDFLHPSQVLADVMTIVEKKGKVKGLKVVYIGDGNNVCNSLMYVLAILGGEFYVVTPRGYEPSAEVVESVKKIASQTGAAIDISNSLFDTVNDADVLYTDVWVSMGNRDDEEARKKAFKNFQINDTIVSRAKSGAIVMHCLPAHRGQEITDSVIDGKNSVVFQQAENRLHTAKAILLYLFKK